jgi:hypothetical protein
MVAVQAFDHPHLPERLVAIEMLCHHASDEIPQFAVATRRRQRGVPEVVPEVEVRVVDPQWPAELERHEPHLLAVARHGRQLGRDHRLELFVGGRRTGEDRDRPDVHRAHGVLDVQERRVLRAHAVHLLPPRHGVRRA